MRSNRTPAVFYDDMLTAMERLELYSEGVTFDSLVQNTEKQDAILYRLLVLTEAAYRLQPAELELCPGPDWKQIRNLGNVIRHNYDGMDLETIWDILHHDLPPLQLAVRNMMREHFPDALTAHESRPTDNN